ncbi:MAG: serine/threonine-protein kinase [Planctomycetota bacterium]
MDDRISDDAFVLNVLRVQLLTDERIQDAKDEQYILAQSGTFLPLGDVLVKMGDLTPALRDRIERMPAEQSGPLKMIGPFRVIRQLGEGSMGMVYLAVDTRTQHKVALKTLPKRHADDSEYLIRFQREARAAQTIQHENIVAAYEYGEDQGLHYFAMELCQGEALDAVLARETCLPWMTAAGIMLQVVRGLDCAHRHGFIHRDVKPANIMMVPSSDKGSPPVAKLLDLGLAKNIDSSQSTFQTEAGALLGTPQYISPEQARGDSDVDGRSDIYSLGATFYHVVTGEAPFKAASAELVIQKHLSDPLVSPQDMRADIPDGVVLVIQKMMAKDPCDRYNDCVEVIRDLENVLLGRAPIGSPVDESRSTVARRREALRRATAAARVKPNETLYLPSTADITPSKNEIVGTWGLSRTKRYGLYVVVALFGFMIAAAIAWQVRTKFGNETPPRIIGLPPHGGISTKSGHTPISARIAPAPTAPSSDILADENFDAFSPAELPAGWSVVNSSGISTLAFPDHGHVLAINNHSVGPAKPRLNLILDPDKIRGRVIRVAVLVYCPKGYEPLAGNPLSKPGVELHILFANGKRAPEKSSVLQPGETDWKRLSFSASIPQNVVEAKICLSATDVSAEVFFDDLKIELLP